MSAVALPFTKMHGLGNDFVVVDRRRGGREPPRERIAELADRRVGIGFDQWLAIEPPRSAQAVAAYRILNADGSEAGQCGNGARCIAAWLVRDGVIGPGEDFELDAPGGAVTARVEGSEVSVDMGRPDFRAEAVPIARATSDVYEIEIDGAPVRFGAVSMGNPHAVIEVEDVAAAPVARLGAALSRHPVFPARCNVGFAQVVARDRVALRVHERGVGETRACGSGACAAAVLMIRRGRMDRRVTVGLPGGELEIEWPHEAAAVRMRGPAAFVYDGVLRDD